MKKSRLVLGLISLASVFSLAACSLDNLEIKSTWEFESEEMEGIQELFDDFVEDTTKVTNIIVTIDDGEDTYQEIHAGDRSQSHFDGIDSYTFILDGEYYYAWGDSDGGLFVKTREAYDDYHDNFQYIFNMYRMIETETATYYCKVQGETTTKGQEEDSYATLHLTITDGEERLVIDAEAEDGLVVRYGYTYTYYDEEFETNETVVFSATMVYGTASVEIPDMTDWTDLTPNPDDPQ